jgi:hypothetical protein
LLKVILLSRRSAAFLSRSDDFGAMLFAAVGIALPFRIAKSSFDKHLPAFFEIFVADEGELAGRRSAMPHDPLLAFSSLSRYDSSVATEKFTSGRPLGV